MKKPVLAATLVAAGLLGLQHSSFAHGGNYRGPGDTVPPGGGGSGGGGAAPAPGPAPGPGPSSGPTAPTPQGPLAPNTPTSTTPTAPTTGSADIGADLTLWSFWWEFNKEPYLNLRSKIRDGQTDTGSDGFFLGRGEKADQKDSLAPTEAQIRDKVVPALLKALANETNNDIVTGSMIALAKIGDAKSESGESAFEAEIAKFLKDGNQEISETAAIALGILANTNSIDLLESLLKDDRAGREAVGRSQVTYRTRAFAAYGLGLIGATPEAADSRERIVQILADVIASDDTSTRDLKAACIISLGLCPIETMDAPMAEDEEVQAPSKSRSAQMQYLLDYMRNEDNNYLVRAHCPTALARLLSGMPAEAHEKWRSTLVADFLERSSKRSKEQNEVIQSTILALGQITSAGKADKAIRDHLAAVPKDQNDKQARYFSLISMAQAGGTPGDDWQDGVKEAGNYLLEQLEGSTQIQPWAGLSIGVMSKRAQEANITHEKLTEMADALRDKLKKENNKSNLSAYAIGTGIMGDIESAEPLMEHLEKVKDNEARGYIAVALGLMNHREAIEDIQTILEDSKYRPELLRQAAVALGLLGDKALVDQLVEMLQNAKGLATQAAISSALGFIGDQRSIDPLVAMLEDKDLTDSARGFAAVALGIVADKEPLPWNSKIGVDLNYRASTSTLVDNANGTGILDIL